MSEAPSGTTAEEGHWPTSARVVVVLLAVVAIAASVLAILSNVDGRVDESVRFGDVGTWVGGLATALALAATTYFLIKEKKNSADQLATLRDELTVARDGLELQQAHVRERSRTLGSAIRCSGLKEGPNLVVTVDNESSTAITHVTVVVSTAAEIEAPTLGDPETWSLGEYMEKGFAVHRTEIPAGEEGKIKNLTLSAKHLEVEAIEVRWTDFTETRLRLTGAPGKISTTAGSVKQTRFDFTSGPEVVGTDAASPPRPAT